jgi:hypothetical protein
MALCLPLRIVVGIFETHDVVDIKQLLENNNKLNILNYNVAKAFLAAGQLEKQ